MKARPLLAQSILIVLLGVSVCQDIGITDIPLEEHFALMKKIEKIVLQPTETYRLSLDDMYRGQNLDFSWNVSYADTGLPVQDNFSPKTDSSQLIQVTPPWKETLRQSLFPTSGATDEASLPQTTLIYMDSYQNQYLILIDYNMYLHIYDISDYYMDSVDPKIPFLTKDLFMASQPIHPDRDCNNLVKLDKNLLMALCKSNLPSRGSVSISLYIDLTLLLKKKVAISYSISGLSYDQLKDGELVVMGPSPVTSDQNPDYLVWVKENTTNCHFSLISVSQDNPVVNQVADVYDFDDPFVLTEENNTPQTETPVLRQERKQPMRLGKSKLSQGYSGCNPQPIDFNVKKINYLQIRDIRMCPYYKHILIAADYNYGLLFWHINCKSLGSSDPTDPNAGKCLIEPRFRVRFEYLGNIATLEDGFDPYSDKNSMKEERVIFSQVTYPPKIIEIDVSTVERPPYIKRIYRLDSNDGDSYYAIEILEANADYILTQLMETNTQKPIVRIYHRRSDLFSSVHTELPLGDFLDSGLFIKFVINSQNSFIVKFSNEFRIIKIQPHFLEFNVWNLTTSMILGIPYNPSQEVLLNFKLTVRNHTLHTYTQNFDLLVTDKELVKTYALVKTAANKTRPPIKLKYICGENVMETSATIDKYFSGKKNRLVLDPQNPNETYFMLSKVRNYQEQVQILSHFKCPVNELVQFQSRKWNNLTQSGNGLKWFLACAVKRSTKIYFQEIKADDMDPVNSEIPPFVLPDSNILEFFYDTSKRNFYIVSDKAVTSNDPQTVIHLYRLYNIFNWEYTINFNKDIAMLKDFNLRQFDMIFFNQDSQIGILISDEQKQSSILVTQQILIYGLEQADPNDYSKLPLKFRGLIEIQLYQPPLFSEDVTLRNARVDEMGFIWALISNGTLVIYSQVPLPPQERDPEGKGMMNLQLIREFQRINLIKLKNSFFARQTLNAINFSLKSNKLIVFTGDNQTQMHDYGASSKELQKSMILPVYVSNDEEFDLQIRLKYVISEKTKKVTYASLENYLLVLYQVLQKQEHTGYRFYIYNINEHRQNSLLMRVNVTVNDSRIIDNNPLIIDLNFSRVQMYRIDKEAIGIILTIDNVTRTYYRFYPQTTIIMNEKSLQELNRRCREENIFDIPFSIYPSDNPKEKVNFTVHADNKGLIITTKQKTQQITLQVQDKQNSKAMKQMNSLKYGLLQNFDGQQMNFSFECHRDNPNSGDSFGGNDQLCGGLKMDQEAKDQSFYIDFLSTKNPAVGFFVIEPFLLFFDKKEARVLFLENKQHVGVPLSVLFPFLLFSKPGVNGYPTIKQYRLLQIEYDENEISQYLVTVNSYNQLSVSRVLSVKNKIDLQRAEPLLASNQFKRFDSPIRTNNDTFLLIQYSYNFTQVYAKIAHIDVYPINPQERDYLGAVLVYDDHDVVDSSSRIEHYIFDLRDQNKDYKNMILFKNMTFKAIYAERLELSTFKVTSIKLLPDRSLLLISLLDIGVMLYDFDSQLVIKIVPVKQRLILQSLNIIGIDPATAFYFRLVTTDCGVITMGFNNGNNADQGPALYLQEPYLHESQGQAEFISHYYESFDPSVNYIFTIGRLGIAYLAIESGDGQRHIRFYSKNMGNNSKALASFALGQAREQDSCNFLQSVKQLPFIKPYLRANEDTMVVALLCGSRLRFVEQNFYPSLTLTLNQTANLSNQMEISQNLIQLKSDNKVSQETLQLIITLLNQERGLEKWMYFMFIAVIGIIILVGQVRVKRQQQALMEDENKPLIRGATLLGQTESTQINNDSMKSSREQESFFKKSERSILRTPDEELQRYSLLKSEINRISKKTHQDYLMEELRVRSTEIQEKVTGAFQTPHQSRQLSSRND